MAKAKATIVTFHCLMMRNPCIFDLMKLKSFLGLLAIVIACSAQAQIAAPDPSPSERSEEDKWFDPHRLFTGGNFGLQLGTSAYFELSPNIGYKVTDRLRPGLGINYQYWRQKDQGGTVYAQSIIGWRGFASYQIGENIFGYGEYEDLRIRLDANSPDRLFVDNFWIGAGYRQWLGPNSAIDMMLLYNTFFSRDPGSVNNGNQNAIRQALYGTPWNLKMGLIIGL